MAQNRLSPSTLLGALLLLFPDKERLIRTLHNNMDAQILSGEGVEEQVLRQNLCTTYCLLTQRPITGTQPPTPFPSLLAIHTYFAEHYLSLVSEATKGSSYQSYYRSCMLGTASYHRRIHE